MIRRHVLTAAALAVSMLLPLAGCVTNPATGDQSLNLLSEEQEIQIGTDAEPQFIQENGGLIPDEGIRRYVEDLGQRLAAVSERPDLPWSFNVLDSPVINAFALPGGKVFISRGLMSQMTNEAQLAGVLGHEVGHVTAQHVNARMSQQMLVQLGAVAFGVAGEATDNDVLRVLGVGTSVGGGVYLLKFGRDQETQSDELGVRYMAKLGYNPWAQVQVMQILDRAQGDGGGPEFFASHPLPKTRIDDLEHHISKHYGNAARPGRDTERYGENDQYRLGTESFEKNILQPLRELPAPKGRAAAVWPDHETQPALSAAGHPGHGHGHRHAH